MKEKSTDELNAQLQDVKPEQIDKYIKTNSVYLAQVDTAFYYYRNDLL